VLNSAQGRQRAKRKRPKASRLTPAQVDVGSTERLFDDEPDEEELVHGRHFARAGDDRNQLVAANADLLLDLTRSEIPLIRYEWHNRAGETMVVEAVWPFDAVPSASLREPDARRNSGHDGWRPREAADHRTPEHARTR
jgi:hypothetical protein